jgi:hypothetical protein
MSSRYWLPISLVMPAGTGVVLYFLLRVPEVSCCKDCGAQERSDFQFCP